MKFPVPACIISWAASLFLSFVIGEVETNKNHYFQYQLSYIPEKQA